MYFKNSNINRNSYKINYLGSMKNACCAYKRRFTGKGTFRSILKIIYKKKLKSQIHIITTIISTRIKMYFRNKI